MGRVRRFAIGRHALNHFSGFGREGKICAPDAGSRRPVAKAHDLDVQWGCAGFIRRLALVARTCRLRTRAEYIDC
jgi:hypothetical protein